MLSLPDLFKLQQTLNERVGLDDAAIADSLANDLKTGHQDAALLIYCGKWIDDMLKAMSSEMEELRDCTHWKHWSQEAQAGERYKIKDVEAARKEVIDLLHFWISLAQILGMTPEIVSDMYEAKLAKNLKRQDDGYSIEVKDLAWKLFLRHPDYNPMDFSGTAESLEDLPDEVAEYYVGWAKAEIEGAEQNAGQEGQGHIPILEVEVETCSRRGTGCKFCGQRRCKIRQYESKLEKDQ